MYKIIAALCLFLSISQAHAQSPTPLASAESIETLMQLSKMESLTESMYSSMEPIFQQAMQQGIGSRKLTPAQESAVKKLPAKMIALFKEEFSWSKMKPGFIQIYQETFTQPEVDGMIAFYQTPVGQAMINKTPQVMQKSVQLSQGMMASVMPRVMKILEQDMKEAMTAK
jgi:uncharacterized protein